MNTVFKRDAPGSRPYLTCELKPPSGTAPNHWFQPMYRTAPGHTTLLPEEIEQNVKFLRTASWTLIL